MAPKVLDSSALINVATPGCHMHKVQLSTPRELQNSEQPTCVSQRQKRSRPSESSFPPAFWDRLSKIDLTKRALEELDRRNTLATPDSQPPHPRPTQQITRHMLAKLKKGSNPLVSPAEYLSHCGTSDLKSIKRTARHGGPDLSDLIGLPEPSSSINPAMNSSRSNSRLKRKSTPSSRLRLSSNTANTASTVSTGPYNRNFQQHLIDGCVYPHAYRSPDGRVPAKPKNWDEINRILSQARSSLSPSKFSDEAHERFVQADADAVKEQQVITSVIPIIEGDIKDAKCVSGGIPFTNLDPLTDGTLVPGNPDIYYGARPEQLDRRVRNELSCHIIPSTQDDLPIAPNFFMAAKGPDGSLAVAGRQASYDGALGARGMHSLQSYGQNEPVPANTASTISSIYHGGQLKMFTIYPSQPAGPGSRLEYFMHQLKGWSMTSDPETFRQGATFYRNARDWTKEQRDKAIRHANDTVDENRARTLAVDTNFAQVSSFTSEAILDTITTEALPEESQTPRTEEPNTYIPTSEASSGKLSANHRTSVKRLSELSNGLLRPRRKRRNAGDSDYPLS